MKKILFFLVLFNGISYSYVSTIGLDSGYISNVTENYTQLKSTFISPYYQFRGSSIITENFIFFLDAQFNLNQYPSVKEEDNFASAVRIKLRNKGEDQVFDVTIGNTNEYYWNTESRIFYKVFLIPEYRIDFDSSSLYVLSDFGRYYFTDNDFDHYYINPGIKLVIEPNYRYRITYSFNYSRDYFLEKYVLNPDYKNSSEKMIRNRFETSLQLDCFMRPFLTLSLGGSSKYHLSNGNYLFFGPYEQTLIVDGDEKIVNNYYNLFGYSLFTKIEYFLNEIKMTAWIKYGYEKYKGRFPLDESNNLITSEKLFIQYFDINLLFKYYFSKEFYLNLEGGYQINASNDYIIQSDIIKASLGIGLVF